MVDLTPYRAQLSDARKNINEYLAISNPREAFISMLISRGFSAPENFVIGKIGRIYGADDKKSKKSGWYVYHEDETNGNIFALANYGDFKLDIKDIWTSKKQYLMSDYERKKFSDFQTIINKQVEVETKLKNEETANKAFAMWSSYSDAKEDHPYLKKKMVKAAKGVRVDEYNNLIIPAAIDNQIVTLQRIKAEGDFIVNGDPIGNKKFEYGGRTKGVWFFIDGDSTDVYVSEGYATAMSVHEATGNAVYVCFNASNIYEVVECVKQRHKDSNIIIAGDDDVNSKGNAGRSKAEQAASGHNVDVIFPPCGGDFNDYHVENGIDSLREYLKPAINNKYKKPKKTNDCVEFKRPIGVMGAIYDYYNATSGHEQHGFAIQTAIAICSTVLGRSYVTNFENYPSLFLLSIGRTATGKEHIKKIYTKVLHATGAIDLIAGDAYTSGSAVISTLIDKPNHGTCCDELGRYLEASAAKTGFAMQREANTKIMEAFGRGSGIMYPMNYSTMTGKKDSSSALKNRIVHNPSITLLTMTTPSTFYESVDIRAVKDGFINRFVIYTSDAKMSARADKEPIEVPESIIDWVRTVTERYGRTHTASVPADSVVIPFSKEAIEIKNELQDFCIEQAMKLEVHGMDGLSGRTTEQAMRLSLVMALSENPYAKSIEKRHMDWAVWWTKKCLIQTIKEMRISISSSDHESHKKEILQAIRDFESNGITWATMQKTTPFSQHKIRELKEILQSLKDANLILDENYQPENGGRPTSLWIALK